MNQTATSQKSIKLKYNVIDRIARKIATLTKMANLNYQLQQIQQQLDSPHILITPVGQLHKQYEIIQYIIIQARQLSKNPIKRQSKQEDAKNQNQHESQQENSSAREIQLVKSQEVLNLEASDSYVTAKMYEKLYQLRVNLFPILQEFYKYLTGNLKTKKSKYDSLMNKIKKEIGKLDADINQHPQIFHSQFNFLNIIIACQIFMACKFVFEEKFRKSKYSLFNKYEKISHRKQFIQVHGKSDLCQKQYIPAEFEQDGPIQNEGKQNCVIPTDIIKMSTNILGTQIQSNRNQLLYNYFKTTFSQNESKKQYFPYFWLMFDDLKCSLVQIILNVQDNEQDNGNLKLKLLSKKAKDGLNPQIDYGIIGLYRSQKDKKLIIRGLICIGSQSTQDFQANLHKKQEFASLKIHKVDTTSQKQKKQVQKLWQHVEQNTIQDQISLILVEHV